MNKDQKIKELENELDELRKDNRIKELERELELLKNPYKQIPPRSVWNTLPIPPYKVWDYPIYPTIVRC